MASVRVNITVPRELLGKIDEAAKAEHRSRSEYLRELARRHLARDTWEHLQAIGAERARQLGINSEADVERLVDEFRAEQSEE